MGTPLSTCGSHYRTPPPGRHPYLLAAGLAVVMASPLVLPAGAQELVRLGNFGFAPYRPVSTIEQASPKCDPARGKRDASGALLSAISDEPDADLLASTAATLGRASGAPIYIVSGFAQSGARFVTRPPPREAAGGGRETCPRGVVQTPHYRR